MNAINDFFKDIAEFREFVPGISALIEFKELNSSAIHARKQIRSIIGADLWKKIQEESEKDSETRLYLMNAFGNLIMHKALIFGVVAFRLSGKADVYKHEIETMKRQYIDNYFNAMDSLIEVLTTDEKYTELWKKTTYSKLTEKLQIKTTTEFDSLYGIDMSYLFFYRTATLQREVLFEGISDTFAKAATREDLTDKLKLALAQLVISLALLRFDFTELPGTIRSLFNEQKASRSGTNEQRRNITLAADLRHNAMAIVNAVELALSEPSGSNVVSNTSVNREDDKFYAIM